ncbi:uncharacterized protein LOC133308089 [Gastrolobium bilobum]|uniref:uncharacterized protein LOC133308089 n=1 Tax=Gastrolobium bilobum TaxID=150636 RepID=UPI002AB1446D|nr:uncharacterized protein LOC133308089 [Gastrolobium bilobum]
MAHDSDKRFHSIMDKLFRSSPSSSSEVQLSGRKRPFQSTSLGLMTIEPNVSSERQQPSSATAQAPLCRPWDRGDFMRRLATFKSISWFAKPKVVSAVNCARRGWINVDIDTIACEVCGSRLLFSTPASWNQQQLEKAALVFSLKLDNGHKLLCPWIDNTCDETLARFPPTPPPVLVDNFRERCSAFMQLSALPCISSSAIDYMKNPLLEDFLEQSLMLECGNESANSSGIESLSSQHELKSYYQAQKLLSLCGWNPRALCYQVDCKDASDQSAKSNAILDSQVVGGMKSNSLIVQSTNTGESLKIDENSKDPRREQMDPNSVVLDCSLCGATVGLWAFGTVPKPVELIRLVGYTELNGKNDSGTNNLLNISDLDNRQGVTNDISDVATSSKDITSSLKMTIAGGPPPTEQNFKAIISFPVIGQNLRARLSYDSDFGDHAFVDEDGIQSNSQKKRRIQVNKDEAINASTGQLVLVPSEIREILDCQTDSQASIHESVIVDDVTKGTHYTGQPSSDNDKMLIHTGADGLNSFNAGDPSSSQKDLTDGEAISVSQKTSGGKVSSLKNYGVSVKDRLENPMNNEEVNCTLGKDLRPVLSDKAMAFDPIKQHRHFCPWIASINDGVGEPGWQQTLFALYHQKNRLRHSPNKSPSSTSIVKVDDPIGSVRKLFMSPSTARRSPTRRLGQSTEHR